jgi:hypothetical protein
MEHGEKVGYSYPTGSENTIQINHQPDATVFQFIILVMGGKMPETC